MNGQRVLAITKRTAELSSTQSLLYREGFELMTATSMAAARCVIKSVAIRGVFVCRDSWSEQERENIISEFATDHPEVTIIMRCAECTRPTHLSKALSYLLTCAKKPTSVPAEGRSPATTYIYCLDCGKKYPYESKQMKVVGAPNHSNRCA